MGKVIKVYIYSESIVYLSTVFYSMSHGITQPSCTWSM